MSYTAASARAAAHNGDPFPENYERVWQDTWGHLQLKVRNVYSGHVLFTLGVHGDITIIDWDFGDLDGSPWLHSDMTDQVCHWIEQKNNFRGGVWRFDGTFERLKNGKSRWRGKVSAMRLTYRFNCKSPKKAR